MSSNHEDVGEFHEKFGLDNTVHHESGPRKVSAELLSFRLNFLLEELSELMEAVGARWVTDSEDIPEIYLPEPIGEIDHAQAFDALLDLNYVSHGTAHLLGYPWQQGWNAVQFANMAKVRAAKDASDSKRGSSFDVVKPEGWMPPDQGAILRRHGFEIDVDACPVCGYPFSERTAPTDCTPGVCRSNARAEVAL